MAKIDEIKELLNTLRVALSISFGILVITIGSLISRIDSDKVDLIFWMGIIFSILTIIAILIIIKKLMQKTKEIKEL